MKKRKKEQNKALFFCAGHWKGEIYCPKYLSILGMVKEKDEESIEKDYGGADGIYIVHSIFPFDCPCQNFYECLGVYKLLKWNLWLEWRRENCEARNYI